MAAPFPEKNGQPQKEEEKKEENVKKAFIFFKHYFTIWIPPAKSASRGDHVYGSVHFFQNLGRRISFNNRIKFQERNILIQCPGSIMF